MDAKEMTRLLRDAAEAIERLTCGDDGLLCMTDTAVDVAALLAEVQAIAQVCEDETGRRFTRLDDSEIEDMVNGWFDEACAVAERHGEEC